VRVTDQPTTTTREAIPSSQLTVIAHALARVEASSTVLALKSLQRRVRCSGELIE
jgi:hypothetical protein